MQSYDHLKGRIPCPHLPIPDEVVRPSHLRELKLGMDREAYFEATLSCAQSLWLSGHPAQALLQLNHSMSADLCETSEVLLRFPMPYEAKIWIFTHRSDEYFLGNPVRHYQHLATRMSGKNKTLRSIRAWLCFHFAHHLLPTSNFPKDESQIIKEKIQIPSFNSLIKELIEKEKTQEAQWVQELFTRYCYR